MASLPFAGQERREETGAVILSDPRFVRICFAMGGNPGSAVGDVFAASFVSAEREQPLGTELVYRWEDLDGAGPVLAGQGPIVEGGFAGPDIASVVVVRADGSRVPALLADGIWVSWWVEAIAGASVEGLDDAGRLVTRLEEGIEVPPPPPPPILADAVEGCRAAVEEVQEIHRLPGESFDAALERVRALPLLFSDADSGRYVFGDEMGLLTCSVTQEPDFSPPDGPGYAAAYEPWPGSLETLQLRSGMGSDGFARPIHTLDGWSTDDVRGVLVILDDGTTVEADVVGRYWSAWWERDAQAASVRAFAADGELIADIRVAGR